MKEISDIKTVHAIILDIAKEIHRVCVKHNIPYYITGGTMLGAIRHKGFIPWDDDIDIVIPRDNLAFFKECFNKDKIDKYSLITVEDGYGIFFDSWKVVDNSTIIVEKGRSDNLKPIGLFVDIFPLDNSIKKQTALSSAYWIKRFFYLNSLSYRPIINEGGFAIRVKSILAHIFPKGFFKKIALAMIPKQSDYCINYGGLYGDREVTLKSYFGKPTLYPFEDTCLFGLQQYDAFLKQIYGDYMKLPPADKRQVHVEGCFYKDSFEE